MRLPINYKARLRVRDEWSVHTLVVCDTEPVAVEGIRRLLETAGDLRLVAAETSVPDAMDAIRALSPSLLLIDNALGIHIVMDCLRALRNSQFHTAAIVWGIGLPEAEALRFFQCGARGAIRKSAPLDLLLHCIRTVAAGNTWMEQDTVAPPERRPRAVGSALTGREMQVMELVERGMKNKDIASALGIRTGTVKIHLKHIFEKTGIHGRFGLALSALKQKGLLAVPVLHHPEL